MNITQSHRADDDRSLPGAEEVIRPRSLSGPPLFTDLPQGLHIDDGDVSFGSGRAQRDELTIHGPDGFINVCAQDGNHWIELVAPARHDLGLNEPSTVPIDLGIAADHLGVPAVDLAPLVERAGTALVQARAELDGSFRPNQLRQQETKMTEQDIETDRIALDKRIGDSIAAEDAGEVFNDWNIRNASGQRVRVEARSFNEGASWVNLASREHPERAVTVQLAGKDEFTVRAVTTREGDTDRLGRGDHVDRWMLLPDGVGERMVKQAVTELRNAEIGMVAGIPDADPHAQVQHAPDQTSWRPANPAAELLGTPAAYEALVDRGHTSNGLQSLRRDHEVEGVEQLDYDEREIAANEALARNVGPSPEGVQQPFGWDALGGEAGYQVLLESDANASWRVMVDLDADGYARLSTRGEPLTAAEAAAILGTDAETLSAEVNRLTPGIQAAHAAWEGRTERAENGPDYYENIGGEMVGVYAGPEQDKIDSQDVAVSTFNPETIDAVADGRLVVLEPSYGGSLENSDVVVAGAATGDGDVTIRVGADRHVHADVTSPEGTVRGANPAQVAAALDVDQDTARQTVLAAAHQLQRGQVAYEARGDVDAAVAAFDQHHGQRAKESLQWGNGPTSQVELPDAIRQLPSDIAEARTISGQHPGRRPDEQRPPAPGRSGPQPPPF